MEVVEEEGPNNEEPAGKLVEDPNREVPDPGLNKFVPEEEVDAPNGVEAENGEEAAVAEDDAGAEDPNPKMLGVVGPEEEDPNGGEGLDDDVDKEEELKPNEGAAPEEAPKLKDGAPAVEEDEAPAPKPKPPKGELVVEVEAGFENEDEEEVVMEDENEKPDIVAAEAAVVAVADVVSCVKFKPLVVALGAEAFGGRERVDEAEWMDKAF